MLARFARHYETGEPIPAELVDQMLASALPERGHPDRASRSSTAGSTWRSTQQPMPPTSTPRCAARYAVTGMPYPEGTFMLAGFGHLLGGYDAGYYGYLWAEVIGDDMFGRFAREGVLSPAVGADYRREILEPNGSRDADALVRAFLGREPSNAEFLRLRGMGPACR